MNIKPISTTAPTQVYQTYVDACSGHIDKILATNPDRSPFFVTSVFVDLRYDKTQSIYFPKDPLKARADHASRQYHRVYRHLVSKLMNNFTRKTDMHPLTFDFMDLPDTRRGAKVNLLDPNTPHIHSVYLVHHKTLEYFEDLMRDDFRSIVEHHSMGAVTSMHALPIQPGTTKRVVSYAAKLLENPAAARRIDEIDLYNQFPIGKFERRPKRRKQNCQDTLLKTSGQRLRQRFSRA